MPSRSSICAGRWLFRQTLELRTLTEKTARIGVNQFIDLFEAMPAPAKLQRGMRDSQRHANSPIARAIHPDTFTAKHFKEIRRARGRALRFRIKGHARPKPRVQDQL